MGKAYIGIDPGITGAIGVIADSLEWVVDVPTYYNPKAERNEYDFFRMYELLRDYNSYSYDWCDEGCKLSLEQQQAMPKQGVSSTFHTGRGYGAWEALCWATTPNFQIVSPRKWKKALGLTTDKEKSRKLAIKLYPKMEEMLRRKKDHNRAEALLLAHYTKLEKE